MWNNFTQNKSLKEEIEDTITDIDIYSFYINKNITRLPIAFNSPLRKDKHASFGLTLSRNNKVRWKDFTLNEGGDVYSFVQRLFGLSFYEALLKIKNDIINSKNVKFDKNIKVLNNTSSIYLQPYYYKEDSVPKSFYDYWNRYKIITKNILAANHVKAVKYLFKNYSLYLKYNDTNPIIGYTWNYKNKIYHKIYQPLNKEQRFISDFRGVSRYLIHNLNKIDKSAKYLIITKSVKDNMVLEGLNYNSISIQNEGVSIPPEIMTWLRSLYKNIYLLYDNDYNKSENWGQKAAKKTVYEYPFLINKKIDGRYKVTDISDFIEKYDVDKTKEVLKQLIN